MNTRLKELMLAAGYAAPELAGRATTLADLIIRECAAIAYEYDAPKMSGPGMIIAGRIETHFGVLE